MLTQGSLLMSQHINYSTYKDSGTPWLGDVPDHWTSIKFKQAFIDKKKVTNHELNCGSISFGNVVYKDNDKIPEETRASYQEVLEGEFLINPLNLNFDLKSLRTALSTLNVVVSTGYIVLQSKPKINKSYLRWLLYQFDVAHMKTLGAGVRQTVNFTDIGNSYFQMPPLHEQQAIANHLDIATTKIDTLIEKQRKLIELLKEKRQAVISTAVTRGLDPSVAMKDSGVEWLGEIPAHWKLPQIARVLLLMEQGKSPECDNNAAGLDTWGVLKTSCVNNGIYNSKANKTLPSSIQPFTQYEVKEEDILMSRASGSIDLIGSVAYVYKTRPKILLSDKVFRIYVDKSVNKIFFTYLMGSEYMRTNIKMAISGGEGMANNIAKSSITKFKIALPSIDEQQLIVNYLEDKTSKINNLITKATKAIDLLKEKRTALISAVVTGKIDVRGNSQ